MVNPYRMVLAARHLIVTSLSGMAAADNLREALCERGAVVLPPSCPGPKKLSTRYHGRVVRLSTPAFYDASSAQPRFAQTAVDNRGSHYKGPLLPGEVPDEA